MTVDLPTRTAADVLDQASDLMEEGVSAAVGGVGRVAERVSDLPIERELHGAAGRVANEADALLSELDDSDARERTALMAVVVLLIAVALATVLLARWRRADSMEEGSDEHAE